MNSSKINDHRQMVVLACFAAIMAAQLGAHAYPTQDNQAESSDDDYEQPGNVEPSEMASADSDFWTLADGGGRPNTASINNLAVDEDGDVYAPRNQRKQWSTMTDNSELDSDEPHVGQDTNIANAKIQLTANDMAAAAGHHHHHHHYVHGKLDMGAHTGKKGSFGWHDKHPVGGKGRR